MGYFDPLYLLVSLPALILSGIASLLLHYWNNKYSGRKNARGVNGVEAAARIVKAYEYPVGTQIVGGNLSDHFDPRTKVVGLSQQVAGSPSVASVAIVAHEFGHVQQYFKNNPLMRIRSFLVPAVNIGSTLGYVLIVAGIVLAFSQLAWVGIVLFSGTVVFSFLTLPVEIDASRRALGMIKELGLLDQSELPGARKVLTGAALTYVAGAVAALLNLLYFAIRVQSSSRD